MGAGIGEVWPPSLGSSLPLTGRQNKAGVSESGSQKISVGWHVGHIYQIKFIRYKVKAPPLASENRVGKFWMREDLAGLSARKTWSLMSAWRGLPSACVLTQLPGWLWPDWRCVACLALAGQPTLDSHIQRWAPHSRILADGLLRELLVSGF